METTRTRAERFRRENARRLDERGHESQIGKALTNGVTYSSLPALQRDHRIACFDHSEKNRSLQTEHETSVDVFLPRLTRKRRVRVLQEATKEGED